MVDSGKLVVGGEKRKLEDLPKSKIVSLITELSELRKKKFKSRKEVKYGNINRGFTQKELKTFLQCCSNKKAYLAFSLMAFLGLRSGEVVRIRIEDIDFVKNQIKIFTEKAHTGDFLDLHVKIRKLLYLWVRKFQDSIVSSNGWVLFSDTRKGEHISSNWLRAEFRKVCYIANLNESYGYADDQSNSVLMKRYGKNRKLYRLTTHSLRHFYITHVYRSCRNPIHTQKLARHREFKSTQIYIHTSKHDLDLTMKKVFGEENVDRDEVEEFMKFYKMWKGVKQ